MHLAARRLAQPHRPRAADPTAFAGDHRLARLRAIGGIVFAETGLLVGLFLPGDSLLFTVGVVAGAGELDIVRICALLSFHVDSGRPERLFAWASDRAAHLSPPGFSPVQAGIRHAHAAVLREARRKNADLREIRADCPDLRAVHGRRGADALRAISLVQYFRRHRMGAAR